MDALIGDLGGGVKTFLEGSVDSIIYRNYIVNRRSFLYCNLAAADNPVHRQVPLCLVRGTRQRHTLEANHKLSVHVPHFPVSTIRPHAVSLSSSGRHYPYRHHFTRTGLLWAQPSVSAGYSSFQRGPYLSHGCADRATLPR